ncbi:MAG TPA: hypothetical protein VGR45_01560 [Stellaceae bacterium]|nr:hypothetical protein [Stellaceae bacterium]
MTAKEVTLPPDAAKWYRTAGDREKPEPRKEFPGRSLPARDAGEESAATLAFRPPTRIYSGL